MGSHDFSLLGQNEPSSLDLVAARKRKGTWGGFRPGAGRKQVLKDPRSVTFDLEEPEFDALRDISEERGIPVAEAIRRAIRAYVRRQRRD